MRRFTFWFLIFLILILVLAFNIARGLILLVIKFWYVIPIVFIIYYLFGEDNDTKNVKKKKNDEKIEDAEFEILEENEDDK